MKGYVFHCQLDYENVPYPCTATGFGTVADNGCGPCCASMVAENMLHISFPVQEACRLAIACGARDKPGTDMHVFAPAFAQTMGLDLMVTEDTEEVRRFLAQSRGMVIANTRGDREGYTGVFSDSAHYIVLTDLEGEFVRVLDPMYRDGRYDSPGRKGKVRMEGNEAIALLSVISQDCMSRPYFLFSRREESK